MPKMIISTKNVSREEIGQLQDYLRGESWEYNDSNPGGSYEGIYAKGGKVPNKEQTREIANELIKQYKKMSKLSPSKRIKADKWELNEETLESGSFDIDLNDFMGDGGSYYISGDQVILASVTPQVPVYNWVEKASKGALLKAKEEELKK
jgi:hypothetical protein